MSAERPRVAILCSGDRATGGGGSTADKVTRDSLDQDLGFDVALGVCNNPRGSVAVYDNFDLINAEYELGNRKINVHHISQHNSPASANDPRRGQSLGESSALLATLEEGGIDFAVMLGYMRILTGPFIKKWGYKPEYGDSDRTHNGIYHPEARILNNHPGILLFTADTSGRLTHETALGLFMLGLINHTAMTWHLTGEGVDTGAVIHEEPVHIKKGDDAEAISHNVQTTEKDLTALVIARHLILRSQHLQATA